MNCRVIPVVGVFLLLVGTVQASSTLIFPRLSFAPQDLTGIAIVNPGEETASVTFTAYGVSGQILSAEGSAQTADTEGEQQPQGAFTNPAFVDILAGQQFARVTSSIFGSGIDPDTIGWIEATSEADDLTGFFQFLDTSISFLDGADLPPVASRLIFQDVRVDEGFSTTAFLVNPNDDEIASVQLSLVTSESTKTKNLQIPAKGMVEVDVAEFFEDAEPLRVGGASGPRPTGVLASEAYLIADSNREIAGFEFVGKEDSDLLGLNARPASELLTTLLFPQLAVLGPFITEAVVGNFGEIATILTLTVYQENGGIYTDEVQTNPVVVALDPGEILRADLEETFGFSGKTTLEGWLKVESTSQSINGSISYSIPSLGPIASVSSVREGSRRALISHLGTADPFFTGLAILNAGALAANVRVVASKPDSEVLGTFTTTLQPGERRSDLLGQDIIREANGQAGGMIWIESDVPVYLTAIFGSVETTPVFANVPAQPVPESFQPDMGIAQIGVTPPLAILGPGQAQQFTLTQGAAAAGVPVWGVNGQPGGNTQTGTISGEGLYTAPAVLPEALPVTITVAADNQTAGASVDVQTKTVLVGGLGIVQSVAYLAGLERLYTSELSFGASPVGKKTPQGSEQSTIFDVTTGSQQSVAVFGDDIPKMISYLAADGKEYLLLAGRTSGSIRRLDPQAETSVEVATGLNGPNALVIDPGTGDLLVAEADQVSTIPASQINQGLAGAGLAETEIPAGARTLVRGLFPTGIAVDPCTGDVYISQATTGEVLKIDRLTGEVTALAEGLYDPTHLLVISRSGISCPLSTHLLVVENHFFRAQSAASEGQIRLLVPATGTVAVWVPFTGRQIVDITLQPGGDMGNPAVLIAERDGGQGQVSEVEVVGRYESDIIPINPPQLNPCLGTVNIVDPDLEAAIRASLPGQGPQGLSVGPITCQAALTLKILFADFFNIETLEGLQAFKNLEEAFFFGNFIQDGSPLAELYRLVHLDIGLNDLTDVEFLAKLTAMRVLYIDQNLLSDTGLMKGAGSDGQSAPRGLVTPILNPLVNLIHLEFILVGFNNIVDLSPLAAATHLGTLGASLNQITELSVVSEWPHLVSLFVGGNPIGDLSPISAKTGLLFLRVEELGISSLDFLAPLTGLLVLGLDDNEISDLSLLPNFRALFDLDLSGNPVADFTPIASLNNLRNLDLANTGLGGAKPASGVPSGNGELDFLTNLTALQVLFLDVNQIVNLGPLSGLTSLAILDLFGNLIADIAPLVANSGLGSSDSIDLRDNELTREDCADLQILKDRGAEVQDDEPPRVSRRQF